MTGRVHQEHLDALCPELRRVVEEAGTSGNPVVETWRGFGDAVALRDPRPVLDGVPAAVLDLLTHTLVADPHYWLGELHCTRHPGWFVVLPYAPGCRDLPPLPVRAGER